MSHDRFWRSRDGDGVVHHVSTVSCPVLLPDNNIDYEDLSTTFCDRYADGWFDAEPDEPTTCFACFVAWLKFESATVDYLLARERSLRDG